MERLDRFVDLLRAENAVQNLVSAASLEQVWTRHIADSAQLVGLANAIGAEPWLDLGTGAGFPGLIVALLHPGPTTLVEQRRLRVDFLARAANVLGIAPEIIPLRVERVEARPFGIISARAFAPLPRILELAHRFSTAKSLWLLPKGRNAKSELEALSPSWQGEFHIEPSLTDEEAGILVARQVSRRNGRKAR